MPRRSRSLAPVVLVLVAALSSLAAGQERFESRISRVRVDVLVHDENGRFVPELTAADFRLYEDGEPQEILGVTLVLPEDEIPAPSSIPPGAPGTPPAAAPTLVPTRDLGTLVYLLDGRALGPRARSRFLEGWRTILSGVDEVTFPTAVYAIDALGRLHPLVPLTTDVERLRAAAEELRDWAYFESGDPGAGARSPETVESGRSAEREVDGIDLDAVIPDLQRLDRGLHTYELIRILSEGLASRPGRKALVWVSTGLDWKLEAAGTFGGLSGAFNRAIDEAFEVDPRIDLARRYAERSANTANVSVYGLDPGLASERRRVSATQGEGPVDRLRRDPLGLTGDSVWRSRDSLRLTADGTGGEAYLFHGRSTEDALREIEEQSARFYLLTYATPEPEGDGRFHDIRVEVDRPGVRVRHRPGYVDVSAAPEGGGRLAAAAAVPGLSMDIPLDLAVAERLGSDGARHVALSVAFQPEGDGRDWMLEAQAVRAGRVVEGRRQQLSASEIGERSAGTGRVLTGFAWPLTPGTYDLRVAVYDEEVESISTERLRVSLGEPCTEWCAGEPWLLTTESGAAAPAFGGIVATGSRSAVLVDVFGGVRPVLGGSVFTADGRSRLAALQAVLLVRRPDGVHTGTLSLPPDLPAGDYLIDVRVTDPEAGRSRAARIPVSVVAPSSSPPM